MVEANVDSWPIKSASLPRSKNSTILGKERTCQPFFFLVQDNRPGESGVTENVIATQPISGPASRDVEYRTSHYFRTA